MCISFTGQREANDKISLTAALIYVSLLRTDMKRRKQPDKKHEKCPLDKSVRQP